MNRIEINVLTGEKTEIDLTPDEINQAKEIKRLWDDENLSSVLTIEDVIQEQQAQIEELKGRLAALEAK